MIIKTFITSHPVLTYYALVFAISWGGILTVVGPAGILGTKYNPLVLSQFVYLAALAGPSVAGILMTGLVDGTAGLRELLSRLCTWRVGARWYAVALLTAWLAWSRTSASDVPSSCIARYPPYVIAAAAIRPSQMPILMP